MKRIILFVISIFCVFASLFAQSQTDEAKSLMQTGYEHFSNERYAEAARYWEKALTQVEKFGKDYENLLQALGYIYMELDDSEGMARILALSDEHNRHKLAKECNEPDCMLERARYYASTGDNDNAKASFITLLDMPMTDEKKTEAFMAYGDYIGMTLSDFASAAEYYQLASRLIPDSDTSSKASALKRGGTFAYLGSQYEQAIEMLDSATDIYDKLADPSSRIECLKIKANTLNAMRLHTEALPVAREIADYFAGAESNSKNHAAALTTLANTLKYAKAYDDALPVYRQSLEIYSALGDSEKYAQVADSYSSCCIYAGKTSEIAYDADDRKRAQDAKLDSMIAETLQSLDLMRKYLGEMAYAESLDLIAGCYAMKGDYPESKKYYARYITTLIPAVRDGFRTRQPAEREILWERHRNSIEQMLGLFVGFPGEPAADTSGLETTAYDALLLRKGILLNSNIEFEKVLSLADAPTTELYDSIRANEAMIDSIRMVATEEDLNKIAELSRRNDILALELYRKCAEFADFTDYMGRTSTDVAARLGKKDVAIEFAVIAPNALDEDNYLYAFVLTKDNEAPAAVRIADMKTLKNAAKSPQFYTDASLGNLVWGNLKPWLDGKKRIFFAPDGILNHIGIEYLNVDGSQLSDRFDVYRLSSTKELCRRSDKTKPDKAALIGGINYVTDSLEPEPLAEFLAETDDNTETDAQMGSGDIALLADLPQTRRSLRAIYSILSDKGFSDIDMLYSSMPTREAFLNLSGRNIDIIHIATHGIVDDISDEARAMNGCRLALAGANKYIGNEDEGGFVSAAEIAKMNLRNCRLAVLSACETAAGRIGADGVFGLQRGFKNSGVRAMLMTLKPVYDSVTADLMTEFYRNIAAGESTLDSLRKALNILRKNPDLSPDDWTSFILLDALD